DRTIADILLQGGTCAQNHIYIQVILHFRVWGVPPFVAADVNHRVPAGNYLLASGDYRASPTGRKRLFCLQTFLLPFSSNTLLGMAVHSTAMRIRVLTVNTPPPPSSKIHTVNPLITPHINPFLP
ncbi:unnamed protein product, partial [Staurois parvus]